MPWQWLAASLPAEHVEQAKAFPRRYRLTRTARASPPSGDVQAYPLDLVRTRLSAQTKAQYYTGIAHALRTIARDEGALGLYRGLGATLLQVTPSLAINYTAYGTLRSHWLELYGQESNTVSLLETPASRKRSGT